MLGKQGIPLLCFLWFGAAIDFHRGLPDMYSCSVSHDSTFSLFSKDEKWRNLSWATGQCGRYDEHDTFRCLADSEKRTNFEATECIPSREQHSVHCSSRLAQKCSSIPKGHQYEAKDGARSKDATTREQTKTWGLDETLQLYRNNPLDWRTQQ